MKGVKKGKSVEEAIVWGDGGGKSGFVEMSAGRYWHGTGVRIDGQIARVVEAMLD